MTGSPRAVRPHRNAAPVNAHLLFASWNNKQQAKSSSVICKKKKKILDLDGGEWTASLAALYPRKKEQESGWAPQPLWTQSLQEKSFCLCRASNPGSLLCRQTLYWMRYPGSSVICILRKILLGWRSKWGRDGGHVGMGRWEMPAKFWLESLKGRDHSEDLGVDGSHSNGSERYRVEGCGLDSSVSG
jgi:hypothetical protein